MVSLPSFAILRCPDINLFKKNANLKRVLAFTDQRQAVCKYNNFLNALKIYQILEKGFDKDLVQVTCTSGQENLLDIDQLKSIGASTLQILSRLNLRCDHELKLTNTELSSSWPSIIPLPDGIVERHLRSYFRDRQKPANLWMCENALDDPNAESLDWKRSPMKSCQPNHLLLVGSRYNQATKKCEYLIHNPDKTKLKMWKHSWPCLCEHNGTDKDYCNKEMFTNINTMDVKVLGCWLPSDHLARNLRSISWLENE